MTQSEVKQTCKMIDRCKQTKQTCCQRLTMTAQQNICFYCKHNCIVGTHVTRNCKSSSKDDLTLSLFVQRRDVNSKAIKQKCVARIDCVRQLRIEQVW